jgi:hypothetical protein
MVVETQALFYLLIFRGFGMGRVEVQRSGQGLNDALLLWYTPEGKVVIGSSLMPCFPGIVLRES